MTESQEEIQAEETKPAETQQEVLDTLRAENQRLKDNLAEAQAAIESRRDSETLLGEAQTENQQLRNRLAESAASSAVDQAAEQLGIPSAMARLHASKFTCQIGSDGSAIVTPDPVEFFEAQLESDPTLRAAVDAQASSRRTSAVTAGAVDVAKVDPAELLTSLDRSPVRKTRFIARHGVKAYLELCDRARRC